MGGASTVKEWRDARSGHLYSGFPYAKWTRVDNEPVIITEPSV